MSAVVRSMMGKITDNPRVVTEGTNLERTIRIMDLLEEGDLNQGVRDVLLMLGDCFPSGTNRDVYGASTRQIYYISALAGFDLDQTREFCRTIRVAGGLDSGQALHLIQNLKKKQPQEHTG